MACKAITGVWPFQIAVSASKSMQSLHYIACLT
jgi:hypothetical protein